MQKAKSNLTESTQDQSYIISNYFQLKKNQTDTDDYFQNEQEDQNKLLMKQFKQGIELQEEMSRNGSVIYEQNNNGELEKQKVQQMFQEKRYTIKLDSENIGSEKNEEDNFEISNRIQIKKDYKYPKNKEEYLYLYIKGEISREQYQNQMLILEQQKKNSLVQCENICKCF